MKKIVSIIWVNILFIIILLGIAELFLQIESRVADISTYEYDCYCMEDFSPPPTDIKMYKPAAIFLGCSFTFGDTLNYDEKIHYKYSGLTNKTAYNLGINGGGPREFLDILRNKDLTDKLIKDKNNIEYVI